MPLWRWLRMSLAASPETDVLRDRLSVGVFVEMLTGNPGIPGTVIALISGLVLVAFLSNAFVAGGVVSCVLQAEAPEPLLQRFFAGAGRFFGRYLRLLLLFGLTTALVGGAAAGATGAATRGLATGAWEPGSMISVIILLAVVGLVSAVCILALDYARIRVALSDERKMLWAWLGGLAFVLRHPLGALGIGAVSAIGWLAWAALAYQLPIAVGAASGAAVVGGFIVQELAVLGRTSVRVAQLGAAAEFFQAKRPRPATMAPTTDVAAAPVDGEAVGEASMSTFRAESRPEGE
jgi:hypothetical protein